MKIAIVDIKTVKSLTFNFDINKIVNIYLIIMNNYTNELNNMIVYEIMAIK